LSAFSDPTVAITKTEIEALKSSFQGDSIRSGLLGRSLMDVLQPLPRSDDFAGPAARFSQASAAATQCLQKVPPLSDGASLGKWAAGFMTGLILGLTLLNLAAARAQREIIVDFTTAPASAEDSDLLISSGDVPPASGGRCWLPLATYSGIRTPIARPAPAPPWPPS
jgi:hypothetical protein